MSSAHEPLADHGYAESLFRFAQEALTSPGATGNRFADKGTSKRHPLEGIRCIQTTFGTVGAGRWLRSQRKSTLPHHPALSAVFGLSNGRFTNGLACRLLHLTLQRPHLQELCVKNQKGKRHAQQRRRQPDFQVIAWWARF